MWVPLLLTPTREPGESGPISTSARGGAHLGGNLVPGLEEEPWRSTILEVLEGQPTPRAKSFKAKLQEKLKAGRKRRA